MSDDPEVISVVIDDQPWTFSYGPSPETPDSEKPEAVDPAKHPEWIALVEQYRHNESMMAEARRVDPMPDPNAITVGQTIDFVDLIARTPQGWLAKPEIGQMIMRRELVLSASAGWKAFKKWSDIEHHRKTPLEAAKELLALLVDRLRRPPDELRLMPLLEAVRLICQPEAAGRPPSGTNPIAEQLYLPNPDTLTVGQMARLLRDQAKSWKTIERDPARTVPDEFVMRNSVLVECPAYHEFVKWSNVEIGRDADFKAADKLFARLSRKTGKLRAEIDLLPVADAMRMITEAPAATVATATLPPREDEKIVAAPTLETVTPAATSSVLSKAAGAAASGDQESSTVRTQSKRTRRPRRITKVQKGIVILKYRAKKMTESIRVEDIAAEADCTAQNLYKSPDFKREWESARERRIKRGWKVEGVADCEDESTLNGVES
jgi:hypothetical protein